MKIRIAIFLCFVFVCVYSYKTEAKIYPVNSSKELYFIENNGQIKDQYHHPRNDIQYLLHSDGITVFIGNGQLHYQFANKNFCSGGNNFNPINLLKNNHQLQNLAEIKAPDIETYRLDVELAGANKNAVAVGVDSQAYYENYYLAGCPINGIQAHTYKKLVYKNIYPFIDWVLYIKDNKLEYDFIINPGGNVNDIKIKYNGATNVEYTKGMVKINTPVGDISERNLYAYEQATGKPIAAIYKYKDNTLRFSLPAIQGSQLTTFVIDPTLEWGTYYGDDTGYAPLYCIATDRFAHIYGCGFSWSNTPGLIATAGSFQDTLTGDCDAFLVKFDTSGHRLWATYYGGTQPDYGFAVTCDTLGNAYMGGATFSQSDITTPGAQETTWSWITQNVGFLAKFDSTGARQWATYIGGSEGATYDLEIYGVCCDNYGNVYASGSTDDTSNVGTPGTFKPYKHEGDADTSIDCVLIKYNTVTGLREWGTYYGNLHFNLSGYCYADGPYVYMSGQTSCRIDTDLATPGSYQPIFGGGASDAFLVKFDSTGNRIWATYYGGAGDENTGAVTCDYKGNVYLYGVTSSDSNIASPGCYQPFNAGFDDAFLVAFDNTGNRLWATYYGGPGYESCNTGGLIEFNGSLYVTGGTTSDTGIAALCAWQPVYGGGSEDAFIAQFNDSNGYLHWASYYGGNYYDEGASCASDGKCIYISGRTNSFNNIATPGSFDPTGGGDTTEYQGFLAKFDFTQIVQPVNGLAQVCVGNTFMLTDSTAGGAWISSNTSVAEIDSATGMVTAMAAGTAAISYVLSTSTCDISTLTITINPLPSAIAGDNFICTDTTIIFTDTVPGGVWYSSNTAVLIIGSSTGAATGVSMGTATITYMLPSGCYITLPDTVALCPEGIPVNRGAFNTIQIHPNPATTELTITSTGNIATISISNLLGEIVYSQLSPIANGANSQPAYLTGILPNPLQVNIAGFPAGMYFVKVNGTEVREFVKQ
jgi:hypothetical protein